MKAEITVKRNGRLVHSIVMYKTTGSKVDAKVKNLKKSGAEVTVKYSGNRR